MYSKTVLLRHHGDGVTRKTALESDRMLGDRLRRLVDHVSHRPQGETLRIMNQACVTLPQILLLNRLIGQKTCTPSALALSLNVSAPAVSQMLDRLFQLGLIGRTEAEGDRRQTDVAATAKAKSLMERLSRARADEYASGLKGVSPVVRKDLADLIGRALAELSTLDKQTPHPRREARSPRK